MSIRREEITLKQFTSGTTLLFFSTHLDSVQDVGFEISPTIISFDSSNNPIKANTFDGLNLWVRNDDNIHIPLTSTTSNYITGHSYSIDSTFLSDSKLQDAKNAFSSNIDDALISGTSTNQGIENHTDYVFHTHQYVDDFFVNIKLNRTFSTLDTLNIYNNLVNSSPTQEANTGVVFGRLMALQSIKDSEGNNIRIPLRNTPIGIFNPSDDYPISSSVSDNGDRLFLNVKESSVQNDYFNIESFDFDKNELLRSASQFTEVPEQYKYITTTNDEGEFVIYDAPIGSQIAVFEVDLLKQGLTRDEIALNFFQFPPDSDAILDQIPNFSFKQFPINIVPSWGTIQTGYTELDITVNMDLRKWTTYFFPPVSVAALNLEQAVASNGGNSAKIEVRDMSKEGYPKTNIKLAEIHNDLDKVSNQQLNWHLEFSQIKNKAEYFKFGCPIIKLPANVYDPNGYKTDSNGIPTNKKGVWLSAYQLSLFSSQFVSRKTGAIYAWNGSDFYTKSHFDANHSQVVPDTSPSPDENAGIGSFPYEQPWSASYPEPYRIPKKPTDERYRYSSERTPTSDPAIYYIDEPAYNDGDLVGYEVDISGAGGFGSQSALGTWAHNRIAEVVTKNFMYKYESGVAWNEDYANGYQPSNPGYVRFAGASSVVNGEKYQRFESGYGYFMKPSGWPRIVRQTWGADTYFGPDIEFGVGLGGDPESPGPGTTTSIVSNNIWASETNENDIYNLKNINVSLCIDALASVKHGTLQAYRVVDSNPINLESGEFIVPTRTLLNWGKQSGSYFDDSDNNSFHPSNPGVAGITIENAGDIPVDIYAIGATRHLEPGESFFAWHGNMVNWPVYSLVGNSDFDPITNRYTKSKYKFYVGKVGPLAGSAPSSKIWTQSLNAGVSTSPPEYDFVSSIGGGDNDGICHGLWQCGSQHHLSDIGAGDGDVLNGDIYGYYITPKP